MDVSQHTSMARAVEAPSMPHSFQLVTDSRLCSVLEITAFRSF